jgi:hypothetical protein
MAITHNDNPPNIIISKNFLTGISVISSNIVLFSVIKLFTGKLPFDYIAHNMINKFAQTFGVLNG